MTTTRPISAFDRIDPPRKAYLALASSIHRAIYEAFLENQKKSGLTQEKLAEKLGKNKAFVSRTLKSRENLTLRTVAAFLWALDKKIKINITDINDIAREDAEKTFSGFNIVSLPPPPAPDETYLKRVISL